MPKSEMEKYKEYVAARLGKISPLLQSYAIGDFSESIEIPEKEDEFTELLVGINLMVDDIRELIETEADRTTRFSTGVSKMIDAIQKVARGDYSAQIELSGKNDDLDSLGMGLNMMIDDIRNEITDRKKAEEKIKHLNAVLSAIRNVNQLIPREKDRDKLLKGICEILIETRGYHNAWVALLDESGMLVTTAEAGLGKDFLPMVERLKSGKLITCGQKALKRTEVISIINPSSTCSDCPLAGKYTGRGAVTMRLEYGGKIYGFLSVSVPRDFVADKEEQVLFSEIAGDIAFALHNIEVEEKRKQAEEKLQQQYQFMNDVIESLAHPFCVIDANDYTIKLANSAACSSDLSKKTTCYSMTHNRSSPCKVPEHHCPLEEVKKTKKPVVVEHIHYINGIPRTFEVHGYPVFDSKRNVIQMIEYSLDITERKWIEEELKSSEERLKILFEYAPDGYYLNDLKGKLIDGNRAAEDLIGYKKEELIGKSFLKLKLLSPKAIPRAAANLARNALGHPTGPDEFVLKRKDGTQVVVEIKTFPIKIKGQTLVLGNVRDVTERKWAEEKIKKSLEEKEVLLKEIHHRVKNNMQIISSLLNIQSANIEDEEMQEVFTGCQNRIRSMALMHETLYRSEDLARIDFSEYIRRLTTRLVSIYREGMGPIALKLSVVDVYLDIDRAVPCGLIISELVSNSLKHAFPDGREGELVVKMYADKKKRHTLIVSDTGVGFPEGLDFRETRSLGMQLVIDLVKQIKGTIELSRDKGTEFKIVF